MWKRLALTGLIAATLAFDDCGSYDLASANGLFEDSGHVDLPELVGAFAAGWGAEHPRWIVLPDPSGGTYYLAVGDSLDMVTLRDAIAGRPDCDDVSGERPRGNELRGWALARCAELESWIEGYPESTAKPLFAAELGRVAGRLVLDVSPVTDGGMETHQSGWPRRLTLRVPMHWFWRVDLDAHRLRVAPLDERRLGKLIDSGVVAVATANVGEARVLNAGSEELRRWLDDYGTDPEAWDEPLFLYRQRAISGHLPGTGTVPGDGVTRAVARTHGCSFDAVRSGRFSSDRAAELVASVHDTVGRSGRVTGREGDVTRCDVLTALGTPASVDSFITDGQVMSERWWYHDPASNATRSVVLRRTPDGWIARRLVGPQRRLDLRPPLPGLHAAAARGSLAEIERILERGGDVNVRGDSGRTALHVAAAQGHVSVVDILLARGADPEVRDSGGFTPLLRAVERGHLDVLRTMLERGAAMVARPPCPTCMDVGTPLHVAAREGHLAIALDLLARGQRPDAGGAGWTPLHDAAARGHATVADLLLTNGADADAISDTVRRSGVTPLHNAARAGHPGLVELLLARGATVDARTGSGWTPLHLAAVNGHRGVIESLLAAGAELRAPTRNWDGETALHIAARSWRRGAVEALLAAGADVTARDQRGRTALYSAVSCGTPCGIDSVRLPVVELLLAYGADPNAAAEEDAPIHRAVAEGADSVVALLLAHGADPAATTADGYVALHVAAGAGQPGALKQLLDAGASPHARTDLGWTPLHTAAARGDTAVMAVLLGRGANTAMEDVDGWQPLHVAAVRGHLEAAEALLRGGADCRARTKAGRTAQEVAESAGRKDVAQMLRWCR